MLLPLGVRDAMTQAATNQGKLFCSVEAQVRREDMWTLRDMLPVSI